MERKAGRKRKRPPLVEFYELYDDKSISIHELCKRWNVKPQTIYQWASYYNKRFNKMITIK